MKKLTADWGEIKAAILIGATILVAHIAVFGAYMTLSSGNSPWWLLVTSGIPFLALIGLLIVQSVQDNARKEMPSRNA